MVFCPDSIFTELHKDIFYKHETYQQTGGAPPLIPSLDQEGKPFLEKSVDGPRAAEYFGETLKLPGPLVGRESSRCFF